MIKPTTLKGLTPGEAVALVTAIMNYGQEAMTRLHPDILLAGGPGIRAIPDGNGEWELQRRLIVAAPQQLWHLVPDEWEGYALVKVVR